MSNGSRFQLHTKTFAAPHSDAGAASGAASRSRYYTHSRPTSPRNERADWTGTGGSRRWESPTSDEHTSTDEHDPTPHTDPDPGPEEAWHVE